MAWPVMSVLAVLLMANATLADPVVQDCPSDDVLADEVAFLQTHVQPKKRISQEIKVSAQESELTEHEQVCQRLIQRLDGGLGQQNLGPDGHDPMFLPTQDSIGKGNCGDSARDIDEPCDKYNTWETFEEVARKVVDAPVKVKTDAIEVHDIGQGSLGDCYFLAALAAIANFHPDIIESRFFSWRGPIFKTQWLVNGQETIVSVDNMVPAGRSGNFFAKPSVEGEWWPVILEKAWAKIFGSYAAIEKGQTAEVIQAITQAPVESVKHAHTDVDALWKKLQDGTQNKFPMTASTQKGGHSAEYGLAAGHAYSVLGATSVMLSRKENGMEITSRVNAVRMFNPWRTDYYKGKIPNTEEINGEDHSYGVFTMQIDEFFRACYKTDIAMVREGYKVFQQRIPLDTPVALKVTAPTQGDFYASLIWPDKRMLPDDCTITHPKVVLKATNLDDTSQSFDAMPRNEQLPHNSISTVITSPAHGRFEVLALAEFKGAVRFIDHVQVAIYAPADTIVKTVVGGNLGSSCGPNQHIPRLAALACRTSCNAQANSDPSSRVSRVVRSTVECGSDGEWACNCA